MGRRTKTKEKQYSCLKCGKSFTAHPPDDIHYIATRDPKGFNDPMKVTYICDCGFENILYWAKESIVGPVVINRNNF